MGVLALVITENPVCYRLAMSGDNSGCPGGGEPREEEDEEPTRGLWGEVPTDGPREHACGASPATVSSSYAVAKDLGQPAARAAIPHLPYHSPTRLRLAAASPIQFSDA